MTRYAKLTPAGQRLALGVTGLFMQTAIDYNNRNVDQKTRNFSAVRTAVKMVVTATGGVLFRELGQKAGEAWIGSGLASGKLTLPQTFIDYYKKYSQTQLNREYAQFIALQLINWLRMQPLLI